MFFFKQHKLNRLYKKAEKLESKLKTCTNKAEKTVLETKLGDVKKQISDLEFAIRYHH